MRLKKCEKETCVNLSYNTCNWCGGATCCFQALFPQTFRDTHLIDNKKLKWLNEGWFTFENVYWVIKPDYETIEKKSYSYICSGCAKQLSKLEK